FCTIVEHACVFASGILSDGYGECLQNACAAARLYVEVYPVARHPTDNTLKDAVRRLNETGATKSRPLGHVAPVHVARTPRYVYAHPHCSTNAVCRMRFE